MTNTATPTTKYQAYRAEVEQRLAAKLSSRERRRLEAIYVLLQRARFIAIGGITHHYFDVGNRDGEPLVLVHGWDCSALWWHHVVEPLASAGYRVIGYDLHGHGFSDNDLSGEYTIERFSSCLHDLCHALALKPHHIAAFSLGAAVALHYAAHVPKAVRSIAFFNFGTLHYHRIGEWLVPFFLDAVFNHILRPIAQRRWWFIPYVYGRFVLVKNSPLISDVKLGELSLRCCDPQAVRVSAKQLAKQQIQEQIITHMRAVTQPILVVAGEGDPVMRPHQCKALAALNPHSVYLEIPRCGHATLFEQPAIVHQILAIYLRAACQIQSDTKQQER